MLGGIGKYFFHYHGNDASADRRLQVRDSGALRAAGAQLTAPNPTVQQIGTGGGYSATPSNNPTSAANARLQDFMPPPNPASGLDAYSRPHGSVPPSNPAPGFDAYGHSHPNGRDFNSTHGLPLNRPPGVPNSSGMTSSGPVSHNVPPAPAPMQRAVPDRHGSAPASHSDNSTATKKRKRYVFGDFVAAQNTSVPLELVLLHFPPLRKLNLALALLKVVFKLLN